MSRQSKKVDVKKLSIQEVEKLSVDIGDQVRDIVDSACTKANKILNQYGLQTKMQIVMEPMNSDKVGE